MNLTDQMLAAVFILCVTYPSWSEDVYPALNEDPKDAPVGVRPYEMDWAGRHEPNHPQLVDFEDLTDWRTRCFNGVRATLIRSRQELLFGDYTARVEYSNTTKSSGSFIIEPAEPIEIPVAFTGVHLWVRGNTWSFMSRQTQAMVGINVLVEDSQGQTFRIPMDPNNHDYWFLSHRTCVSPNGASVAYENMDGKEGRMVHPCRFTGIEVTAVNNVKVERLHFDALQFYVMEYPALEFKSIPEDLPWPTTPDTLLPSLKAPVSIQSRFSLGKCVWEVVGDEIIQFEYLPHTGLLDDLRVMAGGQVFHPCWGGGITFEWAGRPVRPGDPDSMTTLLDFAETPGGCRAVWKLSVPSEEFRYEYVFEAKNKSMLVDVQAEGVSASRLDIGNAKGLVSPKAVYFPYLTYGDDWPKTVCSQGPESLIFLWAACDYYRSDASELFGTPMLRLQDSFLYTGGSLYNPTTAGERNPLRERIFVNISRDVQETLPNIPNPDSDTIEVARSRLWRNIGHAHQYDMLKRYKAYGIDHFIACTHEVGWRESGESFTLRDQPADSIGEERLAEFSAFVRGLGYHFGTYTNYADFAPVNANWDENAVCMNSNGTWKRAWPRCYTLKPLRAAEFEAVYAPRIHARYGTNAQYCDVHTAFKPWTHTDYDARTPGAGMFKMQFNAYARLLYNESIAHKGPVFSEGNYHWFYAGIVDGNYATIVPYGQGWKIEPLVDFDLLKMHTKMTDFGMGFGEMYYGLNTTWWRAEPGPHNPWFDRFTAATIAFGHIGFLTYEWGFEATLKGYYQLQALQQRYAGIPVREIRYHDGQELVDTSTAIFTDAYKRRHIFVEYENGLRLWVNLNMTADWPVDLDGIDYLLPPTGYLAFRPEDILAYSALIDEQRHELVHCADYLFLDSRGVFLRAGALAASGSAAILPKSKTSWFIIPLTRVGPFSVRRAWLGVDGHAQFEAHGLNEADETICDVEVRHGADMITVMPVHHDHVMKYRLTLLPSRGHACKVVGLSERTLPGAFIEARLEIQPGLETSLGDSVAIEMLDLEDVPIPMGRFSWDAVQGRRSISFQGVVPETMPDGRRCWFRCDFAKDNVPLWFDTLIVPHVAVRIEPENSVIPGGTPVSILSTLKSNLEQTTEFAFTLAVGDQTLPGLKAQIKPSEPKTLRWETPFPETPYVTPLKFSVAWPGGHIATTRHLRMTPDSGLMIDLLQESFDSGQCLRGETEMSYDHVGTLALITPCHETHSHTALDGLHVHPPYANGKVGYAFTTWELELPEGRPMLEFALGFRSGSTTRDGCVFKVTVTDESCEKEIFSEQYDTLNAWGERSVDLSEYAGKRIALKLITDVGPNDDSYSDWALWGAPRVVMGIPCVRIELLDEELPEEYAPAPKLLSNMTRTDLQQIKTGRILLETAGVDAMTHPSFLYFNGVRVGILPASEGDLTWTLGEISLTPEALATLDGINTASIKNPNQDYMKVRNLCLYFELEDGRQGSSYLALGPYTSAYGWLHEEGRAVGIGEDLPMIRFDIPLQ